MAVMERGGGREIERECPCGNRFTYRTRAHGGRPPKYCIVCRPSTGNPLALQEHLTEIQSKDREISELRRLLNDKDTQAPRMEPRHPSELAFNLDRRLRLREVEPSDKSMADHVRDVAWARRASDKALIHALLELATDCLEEAQKAMRGSVYGA